MVPLTRRTIVGPVWTNSFLTDTRMNYPEFADPELETYHAKMEQLTQERDAALELAEEATKKLRNIRTERDHYRNLWLLSIRPPLFKRLLNFFTRNKS